MQMTPLGAARTNRVILALLGLLITTREDPMVVSEAVDPIAQPPSL